MAEPPVEEGAPVPADAIDPDLIKLRRSRPKISIVTALGIVVLCAVFLLRLGPDRHFAGEPETATAVATADVAAGKIEVERHIQIEAEPEMAQAIRSMKNKGDLGLRIVPVRGTGDRVWLALPGDGWELVSTSGRYTGRLRALDDVPLAPSIRAFSAGTPRPVFATAQAIRAGLAANKIKTVAGDELALTGSERVAFDVVDTTTSTIIVSIIERLPSANAWLSALRNAGIPASPAPPSPTDAALGQVRFAVAMPVADATMKLEAGELWAARVEPVKRHFATTWATLAKSGPQGFTVDGATVPESQVDLVGIYVARPIPSDAYILLVGENPKTYWHVMPITITLAVLGLLFLWALVRAIKRDVLPTRA